MHRRRLPAAATSALVCLAFATCTHSTKTVTVQLREAPAIALTSAGAPVIAATGQPETPVTTRQREPEAQPATRVEVVALTQETLDARTNHRDGSAERITPTQRPEAFRTPDGKRGWMINLGNGRPLATPAVVDGVVYVGGGFGSHEFYAFDAVSGATRWALRVSDDGPTAAVVRDGVVAFNTESCTLFVVDAETGRPLWSRWLGDPLMSQPAIGDGKVFMAFPGGGGHRLVAFELRTGPGPPNER